MLTGRSGSMILSGETSVSTVSCPVSPPAVETKIEERTEEMVYATLDRTINALLSGGLTVRNGRLSRADLEG